MDWQNYIRHVHCMNMCTRNIKKAKTWTGVILACITDLDPSTSPCGRGQPNCLQKIMDKMRMCCLRNVTGLYLSWMRTKQWTVTRKRRTTTRRRGVRMMMNYMGLRVGLKYWGPSKFVGQKSVPFISENQGQAVGPHKLYFILTSCDTLQSPKKKLATSLLVWHHHEHLFLFQVSLLILHVTSSRCCLYLLNIHHFTYTFSLAHIEAHTHKHTCIISTHV